MKGFYTYVAIIVLLFGFVIYVSDKHDRKLAVKQPVVITLQQKATHRITMLDEDEVGRSVCTATAIGPDVLMTAEHCIKHGLEFTSAIRIDRSTKVYHLAGIGLDGRDHAMLFVDGVEFTNTVSPLPVKLNIGDPVYMYGNGDGQYPARKLSGVVIDCEDPSDIDAALDIACFSMPVIPGDSGSIVYDKDGNAAAIITYRHVVTKEISTAIGFGLKEGSFVLQPVVPKEKHSANPFQGLF